MNTCARCNKATQGGESGAHLLDTVGGGMGIYRSKWYCADCCAKYRKDHESGMAIFDRLWRKRMEQANG